MTGSRHRPSYKVGIPGSQWLKSLLDLLFPPHCALCGKPSSDSICGDCFSTLPRITGCICRKCGKPCQRNVDRCGDCAHKTLHFTQARAGGNYEAALKHAIRHMKYKNGKKLAPFLARFASGAVSDLVEAIDAVAFVPLTGYKKATRGYNQSQLIAREISLLFGKPLYEGLVKVRSVPEQNKLGLERRSTNVRGAFVAKTPVPGSILLVDDVYTTGSTVNECALALKRVGADEVFVLTVARTPLQKK